MSEILQVARIEGKGGVRGFAAEVRGRVRDQGDVEKQVKKIVASVRARGDHSLREITKKVDRASVEELRVGATEVRAALDEVDPDLVQALRFSLNRISKTQTHLLNRLSFSYVYDGFVVRVSPRALSSVGCYIPGGRAAYASSVLMTAGVAKLAGVERVVVCSPPAPDGRVNSAILAAAEVCGVDEVYRVGGAQSIAAMAYGTESISPVQKIVGPGGLYASVAKKLVSEDVPIDFFAGPTELLVVGDRTTDVKAAAWDLVGQAEHGEETLCGFVTWDKGVAERVRSEASRIAQSAERGEYVRRALSKGFAAVCRNEDQAVELVNAIAPEHLEVMSEDAKGFAARVRDSGLTLVGKFAPCAASDYAIGTDHVIPTEGGARLRAGLSALDFVKLTWTVEGTKEGLKDILPALRTLAMAEGLPNHFRSVEARFKR